MHEALERRPRQTRSAGSRDYRTVKAKLRMKVAAAVRVGGDGRDGVMGDEALFLETQACCPPL